MEFFTVLIALGLLQVWGSGGPLQRDGWFYSFGDVVKNLVSSAHLRLLIIVGGPVCITLLLLEVFESVLFGLVSLVLYVGVLLYSLGRGDYGDNLQRYLSSWNHGNFESAYEQALSIGDFQQSDAISDHESLHEYVRRAFLHEGFERWFAVVFWFLLLGPIGALGYRLSYLCGRSEKLAEADRLLALRFVHYLDWMPVRLLALSFSLTGNFVRSFNQFSQMLLDNLPAPELLDASALAAISSMDDQRVCPTDQQHFIEFGREEMLALQGLLFRSVICWLIVIAVITLFSG